MALSKEFMQKTCYILVLLILCCLHLHAQENRYMVFFSDKAGTPYTLEAPEAYLSDRAIARRVQQNIAITAMDLPVDPTYTNGVKGTGADVFFTTKWLNGALIQTDASLVSTIEGLSYVDSVIYVAPGAKLTSSGRMMSKEEEYEISEITDSQINMLGLDLLHEEGYRGEGLIIAFFDGGFKGVNTEGAFQHIYSDNRMLYVKNLITNDDNVYQYSTHGTRVFSATAGYIADEFEGSAYNADFMLFVTEDASSEYRIEEYNWLIAAEKADSAGVDIINGSVGYFDFDDASMNYTYEDMDGKTTIITKAAKFAADRGMLAVVSGGNEGNKTWKYITAPADAENILSVGSVNSSGEISAFSSFGPSADGRIKPEVLALGSGTMVVNDFGTIIPGSGTSFATPLITGLAASLWQANPDITNKELIDFIISISSRADTPDNQYGYGIPSYRVVVAGVDKAAESLFSIYPNPISSDQLFVQFNNMTGRVQGKLYNVNGTLIQTYELNTASAEKASTISLANIDSGVYFLMINTGSSMQKFRIVKF